MTPTQQVTLTWTGNVFIKVTIIIDINLGAIFASDKFMNNKIKHIQQYYQKVKSANKELTKKEVFKDLLNRLYFGNTEIQEIIDKITLGAEATVLNIPRKDKLHKGSAGTLFNNIIIEFENDLRATYSHAKEQLAGYLLGKMRSGAGFDFVIGNTSVIEGIQFAGRLPVHNCHYDVAESRLKETSVKWHLIKQGKSTAFSTIKGNAKNVSNPYKPFFKQSATIVPRAFYFVDLTNRDLKNKKIADDLIKTINIISIKTSANILLDAKAPWKLSLQGQVESKFIFRTAISKSILPFYLYNPAWITLPITVEKDEEGLKKIKLHTSEQLMSEGELKAWRWFANAENIWNSSRTEKNKNINASDYLNWLNKLTAQNLNARYLVLYTASAKDANALVFDRQILDFDFLVESTTYVFYTDNKPEAGYLSSILNSSVPNAKIKDFQAKGLFGPRHVHKKILDVYFPKYDTSNNRHRKLSELGNLCSEKAKMFVENNQSQNDLSLHSIGKLRVEIKKHLSPELAEIDKIVEKIMK